LLLPLAGHGLPKTEKGRAMSVLTALSLVLFVGFVATGLVGFLGWRQRMHEGAVVSSIKPDALKIKTPTLGKDKQYGLEGAGL
jgi:hypothetical protein